MKQYNCQGCHLIDNRGGQLVEHIGLPEYGPPNLNTEGRKANPDWLLSFLNNPSIIRPNLQVKMPSFHQISDEDWLKERDKIVCGNASACIIPFQSIAIKRNQRLFSNSGSASMGYDLPAALGANAKLEPQAPTPHRPDSIEIAAVRRGALGAANSAPLSELLRTHSNPFESRRLWCRPRAPRRTSPTRLRARASSRKAGCGSCRARARRPRLRTAGPRKGLLHRAEPVRPCEAVYDVLPGRDFRAGAAGRARPAAVTGRDPRGSAAVRVRPASEDGAFW